MSAICAILKCYFRGVAYITQFSGKKTTFHLQISWAITVVDSGNGNRVQNECTLVNIYKVSFNYS